MGDYGYTRPDQTIGLTANATSLPMKSGDGYGYGGGHILTIGNHAFDFGEGETAGQIARKIARLWNEATPTEATNG